MHAVAAVLDASILLEPGATLPGEPQASAMPAAVPFDITEGPDGQRTASNGAHALQLLDAAGRLFRRRAVKGLGSGQARLVEWAVAELHGVRVYFDGAHVVVTTRDITP
jgi:hypothetical protein